MRMIFISGVHGVGKSYFCDMVKKELGINAFTASQLIEKKKNRVFDSNKRIKDIDDNQRLLIESLEELFQMSIVDRELEREQLD